MATDTEIELYIRLGRARNVALELADILRRDSVLFKRIKRRTLRWIKKEEKIERIKLDAQDSAIALGKEKERALSKLSDREKKLLGIPIHEDLFDGE